MNLDAPAASCSLDEVELLAVDFETTGLDPRKHAVVSMGWVPVRRGGVIDLSGAGYRVIRGVEVGDSALIHGLTDTQVAAGVALEEAVAELLEQVRGRVLLAHFAAIETQFLSHAVRRIYGAVPQLTVVDTLDIERRHMEKMGTYPRGEDLRLPRVRARYGLPAYSSHNALGDALACAELYLAHRAHGSATTVAGLQY